MARFGRGRVVDLCELAGKQRQKLVRKVRRILQDVGECEIVIDDIGRSAIHGRRRMTAAERDAMAGGLGYCEVAQQQSRRLEARTQ